jgi:hypothetical protein
MYDARKLKPTIANLPQRIRLKTKPLSKCSTISFETFLYSTTTSK